jgi:steroid delta-isomerase
MSPIPEGGDGGSAARAASHRSMAAVEAGDRDAWLALFTDDAVIEDPIGVGPFDPEGTGHRGKAAIAAFWDAAIAPNTIRFVMRDSYASGNEVANVGTITTTLPDGTSVHVDTVATYRVDDEGRIEALRAYWELANARFDAAS